MAARLQAGLQVCCRRRSTVPRIDRGIEQGICGDRVLISARRVRMGGKAGDAGAAAKDKCDGVRGRQHHGGAVDGVRTAPDRCGLGNALLEEEFRP